MQYKHQICRRLFGYFANLGHTPLIVQEFLKEVSKHEMMVAMVVISRY